MLIGILAFIVGLLVSVGLHELGHLVPAKRFGVLVSQYFIGFGPTLWSTTIRGTEYGIKALPLGGFVRIAGMVAPGRPGRVTERRGRLTMAEEARQASAAEVEGCEEKAFWNLSVPKKLAVMFGGPLMNLVLCTVLVVIVMCGIGGLQASTTVSRVSDCVSVSACTAQDPESPARAAGLKAGDVIESWNGTSVDSWDDVTTAIANGGTAPAEVVVTRGSEELHLTVTPVLLEHQVTDASGSTVTKTLPYVGIVAGYEHQRVGLGSALSMVWTQTTGTAVALAKLPAGLWETATSLVTGSDRSDNGLVGIVGVADMAGTITSTEVSGYDGAARVADLLMLIASLNMTLFLFNLIPLLPLDGGHIAGALFEGARRTIARFRGQPDPGPADIARLMPLSYAVAMAFVAMTVLLVISDVVNPVSWLK